MQAENQNFSEFFNRTENLAEKLGVRAIDLPAIMDVSKAMLFAYRKGKYPISWRAWRKLEAAERAAGLAPAETPAAAPERSHTTARDDTLPTTAAQLAALEASISARLDKIEAALRALQSPSRPRHSRK